MRNMIADLQDPTSPKLEWMEDVTEPRSAIIWRHSLVQYCSELTYIGYPPTLPLTLTTVWIGFEVTMAIETEDRFELKQKSFIHVCNKYESYSHSLI